MWALGTRWAWFVPWFITYQLCAVARSLNSLAEKERSDCFPGSDGTSSRGTGCDRVMVWEATLLKVRPAPLHPAQGRMESGSESPAWSWGLSR